MIEEMAKWGKKSKIWQNYVKWDGRGGRKRSQEGKVEGKGKEGITEKKIISIQVIITSKWYTLVQANFTLVQAIFDLYKFQDF